MKRCRKVRLRFGQGRVTMRVRTFISRLMGDRHGTAAIEFAAIAVPLFMMILGMIETGILAFTSAVTEAATRDAARQVRVGTVQTSADAYSTFRAAFCGSLPVGFNCASFYFDVRTFADFTAIALPTVTFDENGVPQGLQFSPGGVNAVVTVRVIHPYTFITPLVGRMMAPDSGTVPVISTAVMRTEPYQ